MNASSIAPAWIAVDWGTTNMRAWAMDSNDTVIGRATSKKGMGTLEPHQFEGALLETIAPWLGHQRMVPVLACGMVGARQGWIEAPYETVPCPAVTSRATTVPTETDLISVRIVPGISQDSPPDVMRGEETQIAGYISAFGSDGVLCLPGTHSKWVTLRDGLIAAFHTEMTGEMFSLLGTHSVLRHSLPGNGWDDAAFDQGVDDALKSDAPLSLLFGIRAASLLSGASPAQSRARLSGILVGSEVAGRIEEVKSSRIALIGDEVLTRLYSRALAMAGGQSIILDAEDMTLTGLIAAHRFWKDQEA